MVLNVPYTAVTENPSETHALAASFSKLVTYGDVVLLSGPLGAGKTHFVRGFCDGLGLESLYEVDSPTYSVVNHYEIGQGVDHLDLYRFNQITDLDDIEFEEMLETSTIKLIEWPERLAGYPLGRTPFLVRIEVINDMSRRIAITKVDD